MRIMWVCNVSTPEAASVFGINQTPIEGWLIEVAKEISELQSTELYICFHSSELKETISERKGEKITYIGINKTYMSTNAQVNNFRDIIQKKSPDIIHVWGTEEIHSYALTEAAKQEKMISRVVLSIQGLVGMYAYHYMAGIPGEEQIFPTMRDIIRRDSINIQLKRFAFRGEYEKKAIKNVNHVVGRTFWDKASVSLINPNTKYHFNNETLRQSFYEKKWEYSKCKKHSIFISQAQYPIKGFHYVLEALKLLLPLYPDISVYVSGSDNAFKNIYRRGAYARYIQKLMRKYKLENHIIYVGMLNEENMCEQFLNSEVFVSASAIENSPNSVGEAMLLGMPIVSSNVGGVSDLLQHEEEGYLYQADAPYMLAYYIRQIFENTEVAIEMGEKARDHALNTHNKKKNIQRLVEIYNEISSENKGL